MVWRYRAQLGIVAFAIVLAISIAILICGIVSPTYDRPLQVGERMPDFALCDEQGYVHDLDSLRDRSLMLICTPPAGLTEQQAARIADIRLQLEAAVSLHTVAIAQAADESQCERAREIAGLVLLDPNQTLCSLGTSIDGSASICLVDRHGTLKFRADVPAQETIANAPAERPLLRNAMAAVSGLVMAR